MSSTPPPPILICFPVTQAAEQVELPLKPCASKEDSGAVPSADEQQALLTATFKENTERPDLLRTLADEAVAALQFIVSGMWEHVTADEKPEVEEELEEEDMEGVTQEALNAFKSSIQTSLERIGVKAPAAVDPSAESASAPSE